jgi:N-methylhydantoinase A
MEAGALRVGPHSAGAEPGPACYGRGGTVPTVTDANALLGRINPEYFLDGDMRLDLEAAAVAVDTVTEPLGLSRLEAAEGILAIVNAKMAVAMRTMTVARGVDPREFALVAFGGAGPMHAAALAEELEIDEVIIPWAPGTFSAWGMLHTDIRRDVVRNHIVAVAECDVDAMKADFATMEAIGRRLLEDDHVEADRQAFQRLADIRYIGQSYFLTIDLGDDVGDLIALAERFHDAYRLRYGHATPAAPIEIVNLRLVAIGRVESDVARPQARVTPDDGQTRAVVFAGIEHDARVIRRDAIAAGVVVDGPAIIEEPTATTTVPPGWAVHLDALSALIMTRL